MPEPASLHELQQMAVSWLNSLIAIPSFSREEHLTADYIQNRLQEIGIEVTRSGNNILAWNKFREPGKKTLVLNSHHDTVKPGPSWTKDPFMPVIEQGKIFGLGSNDAGASLVSLMAAFIFFYDKILPVNMLFIASAEEECSGTGGIESVLPFISNPDMAIVGEPTGMDLAVSEKGLLVLDVLVKGKPGHAAREEGINAIYLAMKEIAWFSAFRFPKVSSTLGEIKMTVTRVRAGELHNMVPAECEYTVDIRITDEYTHEEILEVIGQHIFSEIKPRSTRLRSSKSPLTHPLLEQAKEMGMKFYGSPTLSDQALLPFPSVKIGPGQSERSHTADEFIYQSEIESAVSTYIEWITRVYLK